MIDHNVIDLTLEICLDPNRDMNIKEYASIAISHFALNKKSIKILLQKNIMDLFSVFGNLLSTNINQINTEDRNALKVIQRNVSWIFLALCNNGIPG